MKKRIIMIIFLFIMISPIRTNAIEFCTSRKYDKLKKTAYKTELSYELKFDSNNSHYFVIKADNVSKDVLLIFNGITYEPKKDNDSIVLETRVEGGKIYEVDLYGGYNTACQEEFLYRKKINIPKYNIYSERDECIEYEEFSLCNKWYQGVISSEEEFKSELERYIESIKPKEEEKKEEVRKNIIEEIIEFYTDNIKITLPITIIVIIMIIYKIIVTIIRRRKRVKLDS